MALEQIKSAALDNPITYKMLRMEESRLTWRKAMLETNFIGEQVRGLAESSCYAKMAKEIKTLHSPVMSIALQYKNLMGPASELGSVYKAWQDSERAQMARMRKMFEPMADIRKSLLGISTTQHLIKELTESSSIRSYIKEITEQSIGTGSIANMLAQQAKDSRDRAQSLLDGIGMGDSIQSYLKGFEHINKAWKVPNEVLGIMGSFKEIQNQLGLGTFALPTIDWGSAATLAKAMGAVGIHEQLALLGIESDGSMRTLADLPEKGILSKKQADAITLISFLLIFVVFFYQEYNNAQQQAKTDAFQIQSAAVLQEQAQQIQSLRTLIENALVQAAQKPQERFVVRERPTSVRSSPDHGARIEGKLMPSEVVQVIDKDGKWAEVEYYHWLHEEYRTGWVMKKYLERVPASRLKD